MQTYRIIGADGKEYGPISDDVLRQWIAQGRANAQTRVRAEGGTEWKTVAEWPEFAADLGAKTAPPPPPPTMAAAQAQAVAAELLARDYRLEIGRCIGRGWDLVMKNFWLSVGATFLINLVAGAVGGIPLIGAALGAVFVGGLDWMFLKMVRGQKGELGDAFSGFNLAFLPLALYGLVAQLLVLLGTLLCILPGIYLAVCWFFFTALLIIDKRLDFWQAMEVSRKVVSRHWWQVFAFALVCILLHLCGTLVCLVGVLVAMPVVKAATVYAYEDIFGARPAAPAPVLTTPAPGPALV